MQQLQLFEQIAELITDNKPKKILKGLEVQDAKYLQNKRFQLVKKMPHHLRPNEKSNEAIQSLKFTQAYQLMKETAYLYERQTLLNILQQHIPQQSPIEHIFKQQNHLEKEKDHENVENQRQNSQHGKKTQNQPISTIRNQPISAIKNQPISTVKNLLPPFVKNMSNFTDTNANSKGFNKNIVNLAFNEHSHNMSSFASQSKVQGFMGNGFPSLVIGGDKLHPKQTIFAPDSHINVQQIMKYTLGTSFNNSSSSIKEPMPNPFIKAPTRIQKLN